MTASQSLNFTVPTKSGDVRACLTLELAGPKDGCAATGEKLMAHLRAHGLPCRDLDETRPELGFDDEGPDEFYVSINGTPCYVSFKGIQFEDCTPCSGS